MKSVVRDLENRLVQATSATECLATLLDLAQAHAGDFRNLEGLRAAREALNIARARGDSLAVGRALGTATLCHYQRGDYVAAVATGLDAVEAYADGDMLGRSNALQSIALALFAVEVYDLAQTMAARSVADARACGDAQREAVARSVQACILCDRGQFNEARRHFRHAAACHRLHGDTVRLKKSIANIGHTYRQQGIAEEGAGRLQAAFYWNQALRVYRIALASGQGEADDAIILGTMAECEFRLGDVSAAYADVARALAFANEVGSEIILAPCHLWKSRILEAMGELDAAVWACERAVEAAEALEHDEILMDAVKALSALEDQRGRFERAADLEKRARRLAVERQEFLARVRIEMGPLWDRYTAERPPVTARSVA
ncbi:MAG: hypothetical protein ACXWAC_06830 [Usitatibacter sp.]